jgi:hypothetical protein
VEYSDFDQVAFYPQATDLADPLYDPSMSAPWVCINITSDTYGFSMLTADIHARSAAARIPVRQLPQDQRASLYGKAAKVFQRLAESTIQNYADATDPAMECPIRLTEDRRHYIAPHDESAFVELVKAPHRNEMPAVYVPRIVAQWEACLTRGFTPDMSAIYSAPVAL